MRFTAKWDSEKPEENCRTFIIALRLGPDHPLRDPTFALQVARFRRALEQIQGPEKEDLV